MYIWCLVKNMYYALIYLSLSSYDDNLIYMYLKQYEVICISDGVRCKADIKRIFEIASNTFLWL